jgi:hypothetical protein
MQIVLEEIRSNDQRTVNEVARGEVLTQTVLLSINGRPREFTVSVHANPLPSFDASVVAGDELLEELLRFEPAVLNRLCSLVGKYRRGVSPSLPTLLLDREAHEPAARAENQPR